MKNNRNRFTALAAALSAAAVLFAGCSQPEDMETTAYDNASVGYEQTGERQMSDTVDVASLDADIGNTSDFDTTGSEMAPNVNDMNTAQNDTGTPEPPDYDFSNAVVAPMTVSELQSRMRDVDLALNEARAKAMEPEAVEGVEELRQRAESVSEEVASLDTDTSEEADPELIKDVLEVQVEVDEFHQAI